MSHVPCGKIRARSTSFRALLAAAVLALPLTAGAAVSMTPLSTFGTNGWLAPGSSAYLGTANNERGLAYGNGHLYLVSRAGGTNIRVLNSTTGADLGGLNTTGITGGTFAVNAAGVGADGVIYVGNLTTNSATSAFKVYSWANEGAVPAVAYTGAALSGARIGDTLAATGSGSSTRLAAGFGSSPVVAGNNSYAIIDPTAGTSSNIAFTGTPPNAGDFRLGLTFAEDANHVIGTAGSSLYRYTSYSGTAGTLIGSPAIPDPAGASADRLLAYTVIGGMPILAVQSIGDSHVSIYDVTNPAAPVYLTSGNNTTGALTANANGSGQLAWAPIDSSSATLYAMSTNQGIQAFTISVPEPSTLAATALALLPLLSRRRHA